VPKEKPPVITEGLRAGPLPAAPRPPPRGKNKNLPFRGDELLIIFLKHQKLTSPGEKKKKAKKK